MTRWLLILGVVLSPFLLLPAAAGAPDSVAGSAKLHDRRRFRRAGSGVGEGVSASGGGVDEVTTGAVVDGGTAGGLGT